MPRLRFTQRVRAPQDRLFAFFCNPANIITLAPAHLRLTLIQGPECVQVGSQVTVSMRRHGLTQKITSEVVEWERPRRIVEVQRQGPFTAWRLERTFESHEANETEVIEEIDFAPPGGMLGMWLTAALITQELTEAYAHREARLLKALETEE